MSYELDFWRYKAHSIPDHLAVYSSLCDDEPVEDLELLPIPEMMARIAGLFADWKRLDPLNFEHEGRGSFQLSTTPRSLRVDCYGMAGEDMNRFIDMGTEFGCPLFDPQTGVRFDGPS